MCDENHITNEGLSFLLENGKILRKLKEIHLSTVMIKDKVKHFIDDESFLKLAESIYIENLEVLSLKGTKVTSYGLNQFL